MKKINRLYENSYLEKYNYSFLYKMYNRTNSKIIDKIWYKKTSNKWYKKIGFPAPWRFLYYILDQADEIYYC